MECVSKLPQLLSSRVLLRLRFHHGQPDSFAPMVDTSDSLGLCFHEKLSQSYVRLVEVILVKQDE